MTAQLAVLLARVAHPLREAVLVDPLDAAGADARVEERPVRLALATAHSTDIALRQIVHSGSGNGSRDKMNFDPLPPDYGWCLFTANVLTTSAVVLLVPSLLVSKRPLTSNWISTHNRAKGFVASPTKEMNTRQYSGDCLKLE